MNGLCRPATRWPHADLRVLNHEGGYARRCRRGARVVENLSTVKPTLQVHQVRISYTTTAGCRGSSAGPRGCL
jgi:hypothetical protein